MDARLPKRQLQPGDGDPRHGTINGYVHGKCRCDDCSAANTEHLRRWSVRHFGVVAANPSRPACGSCLEEIEACDGLHSDWMHSATRREFCANGVTLAEPIRVSA